MKTKDRKLVLTVQYATRQPWVPSRHRLATWACAALDSRSCGRDLTVRIVGAGESRKLNRRYRNRDGPTNVLSFPATVQRAEGRRPLGDLVVCAPLVEREAREQDKTREAHWAHMIVHGTLHLLGYDHERVEDARHMERREVAILAGLGVANPYGSEGEATVTRKAPVKTGRAAISPARRSRMKISSAMGQA